MPARGKAGKNTAGAQRSSGRFPFQTAEVKAARQANPYED